MIKEVWLVMTIAMATDGSGTLDSDAVIAPAPIESPQQCQDFGQEVALSFWAPRQFHTLMTACMHVQVTVPDADDSTDPHANLPPDVLQRLKDALKAQPRNGA